ncbi:UDP-glucose/GDP-mannose dehydrogenase family protein [Actinomadura sp. NPDC047616]|uniref:UDP-glucose dehydrogenase family protein n=1 Tax=Actinomadura sp. NPDC047616 TaxID=3155914 RepID=UPI0033D4C22D
MRVTVIGTGYLGATHAACMAELGAEVLGVDIDPDRITALSEARVPFYEPGLDEMIRRHVGSGRLSFTTSLRRAAEFGDVHFLCVGTPQRPDSGSADLSYLFSAIDGLAPYLRRTSLIIGKSTVPVGTAARLTERLRRQCGPDVPVEVAWNPEFLQEGTAVENTLDPDRLVFGVSSDFAEQVLRDLYADLIARGVPVVVTDIPTSELIKSSANAFLATKVSFINAVAEVCEAAGADVRKLAEALSLDPRIGHTYLRPGIGFGGGCLPKDLRALRARADELGVGHALRFLGEVDDINLRARERVIELAREECGGSLAGRRVCVLGAAFKPNSDDIRDSPALAVAAALRELGSEVSVYDPKAADNARKQFPDLDYALSAADAAQGAAVVLHLTEWAEFGELDPAAIGEVVAERRIIDGRNTLDGDRWRAAGWRYRALGRNVPQRLPARLLPSRLPAA